MTTASCVKRLYTEFQTLDDSLPCEQTASIWVRFDDESPQFVRVAIMAPLPGPSPYAGGVFLLDVYCPPDYPRVAPHVTLRTTGSGKVRFGPNLYANGKVCLSLLGTWEGPSWDPQTSSLHQVLVSLQGLVLSVEHPYFLEPGHGGWEGHIQEGQFQSTGYTLRGDTVSLEQGLPPKVVQYEDAIRQGTAQFAMLEHLQGPLETRTTSKSSLWKSCGLAAPMHAHFYRNRAAIVEELHRWLSDAACGRMGPASNRAARKQLDKLVPMIQERLAQLGPPDLSTVEGSNGPANAVVQDMDMDAAPSVKPTAAPKDDRDFESDNDDDDDGSDEDDDSMMIDEKAPNKVAKGDPETMDPFSLRRQRIHEAADQNDYVLAGKIQKELQTLEDLHKRMKQAAAQNDFIRAGRLQAQFQALTATDDEVYSQQPENGSAKPAAFAAAAPSHDDDASMDSDESMDSDDDVPMPGSIGIPPFAAGHPQMPPAGLGKNVFAPPGKRNYGTSKRHSWGTGYQLAATTAPAATSLKPAPTAASVVTEKPIPREELCRLRIRLPNNQTVVEDFDKRDPLSSVYRRLTPHMPEESGTTSGATINPRVHGVGAFSQPLSSTGFTLLLARPKREFGLEMHGTKSLDELNLSPSATLTVMKCSDRGVMHRGELESRLREAQGDALDVDGLTYEGLVELTERLGAAGPSDGNAYVSITEEDLKANSETMSPAAYLAFLANNGNVGDDDPERRCSVCFGEYDSTDETQSLRKLSNCGHIFHLGCLATWLRVRSSCPYCKTSVSA